MIDKSSVTMHPLNEYLEEYKELNTDNEFRPVAVGRYGIRTRESIYSKELAKDYSKNKLIHKGTLTVGMGSVQMDIGILSDDETYSVSPAYHTYKINGIDYDYLRYCLQCRNMDMFTRFMKRGSRQGKSIDLKRWIGYEIPVYPYVEQIEIVENLEHVENIIQSRKDELTQLDNLIKARFVEMFGNPIYNSNHLPIKSLNDLGDWASGGTPSRTVPEYFEGNINWYSAGELNTLFLEGSVEKITEEAIEKSAAKLFKAGSMLVGMYDTAAFKMGILKENSASNQACACITPNDEVNIIWLYYELQLMKEHFLSQRRGVRQKNLNLGMIKGFELPVANRDQQREFVDFVQQVDKSKFVGWKNAGS